jgi:hypothetical protein
MKLLMAVFAFALCYAAYANEGDVSKAKQEFLSDLETRIANLTQAKNCVSAAQNHDALKACREALHSAQKQEMMQMREKHKADIDARIQKLQEEKTKLQQEQNKK